MPDEGLRDVALRKVADKMRPLKILEDAIRQTGREIEEEADAYLAEELFHGKVEYDLRQLREQYVEPLAEGLAKAGISQAELDDYLYARHAPERNATVAERNPDDPSLQMVARACRMRRLPKSSSVWPTPGNKPSTIAWRISSMA